MRVRHDHMLVLKAVTLRLRRWLCWQNAGLTCRKPRVRSPELYKQCRGTGDVEAGGSEVPHNPGLHSKSEASLGYRRARLWGKKKKVRLVLNCFSKVSHGVINSKCIYLLPEEDSFFFFLKNQKMGPTYELFSSCCLYD